MTPASALLLAAGIAIAAPAIAQERLERDFERVSGALDYMRKVYFGKAAIQEGLDNLIRRFDTWN